MVQAAVIRRESELVGSRYSRRLKRGLPRRTIFSTLVALLVLGTVAFAQDYDSEDLVTNAIATYADIIYASYADSLTAARSLDQAIDAFLASPSEITFEAARLAWFAANEPYGQTEVARFYGGPIDGEDGPEGLMNAWPLDEAYIDYVEGAPGAGIINDPETYPEITRELLMSLNEQGAEENIATGYHAIEFLLWGQDLYEGSAGRRPVSDYTTAPNAGRRSTYLRIVSDLLVDHLEQLTAAWAPGKENYRDEFLALPTDEALANILTGMGVLAKAELGGERVFTALDNQDQEDEHSCFSDNTHRDIVTNLEGVRNVYFGRYVRLDGSVVAGPGIEEVIAQVDPELATDLASLLNSGSRQALNVFVPFDRAIVGEDTRPQVLDLVGTLFDTGDVIAQGASSLGITISTALPE